MKIRNVLISLVCLLNLVLPLRGQTLEVKGSVIDQAGLPVIGAGVMEVGTTNGAVTDLDGVFALKVTPGAMLEISCIGYAGQTLPAADGMKVILSEDTQMLEETVVVGYGVQRKSDVTGAIAKVDASDMANRTITSAQDALGGKTSGVQMVSTSGEPGAASTIRVRGYSSNYSSDPLYIVDGLKVKSLSSIDANDIESIEVLKDGASAAIYGAEAGNGVVLVTTRKAGSGKTTVTYDFQLASTSIARKPSLMNAEQYLQYYREKGTFSEDRIFYYYDGVTDNDWFESTTESSLMMKHSLSFSQASDKGNILVSLNYLDHDGFLRGDVDTHKRAGMLINAELKMKKWLTVGTNTRINYSRMNTRPMGGQFVSNFAQGPFVSMSAMDPLTPVLYDSSNLPFYIEDGLYNGSLKPIKDADGNIYGVSQFVTSSTTMNPLAYMAQTVYNNQAANIDASFYANLMPVKGLVITSRLGTNITAIYSNAYAHTHYENVLLNETHPSVTARSPLTLYYQWENFANYSHSIGQHTLGGMIGMSFSRNQAISHVSIIDRVSKELPNFGYLDYAASDATKTISGDVINTGKLSYFGRLDYNYANRYMLEVTFRADANDLSILPLQNRWGYFPAVSAGWIFSNEDFFPKNPDAVTFGKLRLSWGRNGSISNLGRFMYSSAMDSSGSYSFDGTTNYSVASVPQAVGNYGLTWETTQQTDAGIDFRFFHDKLSFSLDYYIKDTKDLLISGVLPSLTAGNKPSPINAGNVRNSGFDFDVSWKDRFGDFWYGVSGNVATLRNRVTYLDPAVTRIEGGYAFGSDPFTFFEEGYPVWYMRGYKMDHMDPETGNPVFVTDENGNPVKDMIGSAIPKVTAGITFTGGLKGWDYVIFGTGAFGGKIFNNLNSPDDAGINRWSIYYDERWTTDNKNATRPRADIDPSIERMYLLSDANVFDGSYFKIKQIQIGYSLPEKITHTLHLEKCRAYVSLDDFFTFTKYPGADPEITSRNSTYEMGLDNGSYPSSRKVVFGVNLTF